MSYTNKRKSQYLIRSVWDCNPYVLESEGHYNSKWNNIWDID